MVVCWSEELDDAEVVVAATDAVDSRAFHDATTPLFSEG